MSDFVAVVTGALTGIGRATALAFAADGAKVVVSGRHSEVGEALVTELKQKGASEAIFVKTDVRFEGEVETLIDRTVQTFGRLDAAVNNAGRDVFGPFEEITPENYSDSFDTNLLGTMMCMKHEFRAMKAHGGGTIVNLSSIFGRVGFPGGALYVAGKHAIDGLTRSAAIEWASAGVRVNSVAPGPIRTPMFERATSASAAMEQSMLNQIPAGRVGRPEEVANLIVFLTSDKAPYITGETISIDGGFTAG